MQNKYKDALSLSNTAKQSQISLKFVFLKTTALKLGMVVHMCNPSTGA